MMMVRWRMAVCVSSRVGHIVRMTWDDSWMEDEGLLKLKTPGPFAKSENERAKRDQLRIYLEGTGGRGRVGGGPGQGGRLLFAMLDSS